MAEEIIAEQEQGQLDVDSFVAKVLGEVNTYKLEGDVSFSEKGLNEIFIRVQYIDSCVSRLDFLLSSVLAYKIQLVRKKRDLELRVRMSFEDSCRNQVDLYVKKAYAYAEREVFYNQKCVELRMNLHKAETLLDVFNVLSMIVEGRLRVFQQSQFVAKNLFSLLETSFRTGDR